MPHFYLVRHGQKERQFGDPALTDRGHQQAHQTGLHLKQFPITHIVASPRLRTQQTAQKIADQLKLPITTNDLLRERIDFLDSTYDNMSEFMQLWVKATRDRDFTPTGGDSSRSAGNRIAYVLKELAKTDHQHIVVVTHGGSIADFVRNTFDDAVMATHTLNTPHGLDYRVDECSITTVLTDGQTFELKNLVSTDHLAF